MFLNGKELLGLFFVIGQGFQVQITRDRQAIRSG